LAQVQEAGLLPQWLHFPAFVSAAPHLHLPAFMGGLFMVANPFENAALAFEVGI
jgi:hypothetical protein